MPIADVWGEMNIYIYVWLAGLLWVFYIVQRWSGVQGVLAREICCRVQRMTEVDHSWKYSCIYSFKYYVQLKLILCRRDGWMLWCTFRWMLKWKRTNSKRGACFVCVLLNYVSLALKISLFSLELWFCYIVEFLTVHKTF